MLLSTFIGLPMKASVNVAVQDIFELIANNKLKSKKIAAKTPATKNNTILAIKDLIKICV